MGKFLNAATIKSAAEALQREVMPNNIPPDAAPEYRISLTQALLYKVPLNAL